MPALSWCLQAQVGAANLGAMVAMTVGGYGNAERCRGEMNGVFLICMRDQWLFFGDDDGQCSILH